MVLLMLLPVLLMLMLELRLVVGLVLMRLLSGGLTVERTGV